MKIIWNMHLSVLEYVSILNIFLHARRQEPESRARQSIIWQQDSLDRNPEELYVFEDALYAIQTAKLAGYHTVGVYDEESKEDQEMIRERKQTFIWKAF